MLFPGVAENKAFLLVSYVLCSMTGNDAPIVHVQRIGIPASCGYGSQKFILCVSALNPN